VVARREAPYERWRAALSAHGSCVLRSQNAAKRRRQCRGLVRGEGSGSQLVPVDEPADEVAAADRAGGARNIRKLDPHLKPLAHTRGSIRPAGRVDVFALHGIGGSGVVGRR